MGGGRVIQVATKEQWDKIMAENPGKAVSAPTGRAKADLLQVFGEEGPHPARRDQVLMCTLSGLQSARMLENETCLSCPFLLCGMICVADYRGLHSHMVRHQKVVHLQLAHP